MNEHGTLSIDPNLQLPYGSQETSGYYALDTHEAKRRELRVRELQVASSQFSPDTVKNLLFLAREVDTDFVKKFTSHKREQSLEEFVGKLRDEPDTFITALDTVCQRQIQRAKTPETVRSWFMWRQDQLTNLAPVLYTPEQLQSALQKHYQ